MAKRKKKDDAITEEKLFWYIATAYVGWAVGRLDKSKEAKLDQLCGEYAIDDWKHTVEESLGIDATFVRSVYALCSERKPKAAAIGFILRGLGCSAADERIAEVFG